jgi:ankyrin repeat protein
MTLRYRVCREFKHASLKYLCIHKIADTGVEWKKENLPHDLSEEVSRYLLVRHFYPSVKFPLNYFYYGMKFRDIYAAQFAIDHGAPIDRDIQGLLRWATREGYLSIIRLLSERKMLTEKDRKSALVASSRNGYLPIVKFLVEDKAGAGLYLDLDTCGDHALSAASENGHTDVVKFLIQAGVSVHACNDAALRWASQKGHLGIAEFLVKSGANVNAVVDYSIRWASKNGHLHVAKFLIENGANVHAYKDEILSAAAHQGNLELAGLILSGTEH